VYAPLIVEVQHDLDNYERQTLLNPYCQIQFQRKILPQIEDNTLLLLEGSHQTALQKKEDQLYFWNKYCTEQFMGTSIGPRSPSIGYRDGRCLKHPEMSAGYELICYMARHIHHRIHLTQPAPQTHAELCHAFCAEQLNYHIDESWWYRKWRNRRYCRGILDQLTQFDQPMIAAAREWGESGRHALILCGTIHAFTMHRSTGWPIIFLSEENQENIHQETTYLISCVLYPEAVLGKMPLVLH
jgi:hypothetical protein